MTWSESNVLFRRFEKCRRHFLLGVTDPFVLGVADPFSLATTSVARASAVGLEKLETLEALEELEKLEELVRLEPLEHLEKLETLEKQARNEKKRGSFAQKSGLFLEIQKKRRIFAAIKDVRGSNEAPHFCL